MAFRHTNRFSDDPEALDYWDGRRDPPAPLHEDPRDAEESSRWFGYVAVGITLVAMMVGLVIFAIAMYSLLKGL